MRSDFFSSMDLLVVPRAFSSAQFMARVCDICGLSASLLASLQTSATPRRCVLCRQRQAALAGPNPTEDGAVSSPLLQDGHVRRIAAPSAHEHVRCIAFSLSFVQWPLLA